MDKLSGEVTLSTLFFYLPSEKRSTLKGKSLLPQTGVGVKKSKEEVIKFSPCELDIYQVCPVGFKLI